MFLFVPGNFVHLLLPFWVGKAHKLPFLPSHISIPHLPSLFSIACLTFARSIHPSFVALALPRDGGRPLFFAGMIYLRSPFLPTGPSLSKNLGADPSSLQPLPCFPCNNQGSIPQLGHIFRPQHEHNLSKLFFQCF